MEATGNCTIAVGTIKETRKQAKKIIDAGYGGYVSHPVAAWYLVIPHI